MAEELRIDARHTGLAEHLSLSWRQRGLIVALFRQEWLAKSRRTLLGRAWWIFGPLIGTSGLWFILFRFIDGRPRTSQETLFFLRAAILWGYFASVVSAIASSPDAL